jgi:hypothetical protein
LKRAQLHAAILTASLINPGEPVLIIGSQSVLGTWDESELPKPATMSLEVDMLPFSGMSEDEFANYIEHHAGVGSDFAEKHGFYIDGVDSFTATLPSGWKERLVEVRAGSATGLCLDPHDLCISKLVANRDQDRLFVQAMVEHGLIRTALLFDRLGQTELPAVDRKIVGDFLGWLATREPGPSAPA